MINPAPPCPPENGHRARPAQSPGGRAVEDKRSARRAGLNLGALSIGLVVVLLGGASHDPYPVTQKGRAFNPGVLSLHVGDTVEIINDDGELIHHAYVSSDTFSFDSGDQEPGSKTDVVFSVAGHFTVLCGIHPKMHLGVDVK